MLPDEFMMMDLMARQQFSASSDPSSVHVGCASWELKVEVKVKPGVTFWPSERITIQLTRIGSRTGWKKGEAKDLSRTRLMSRESTDARFEGSGKKRYTIRVVTQLETWFHWQSTEVDKTFENGDDETVQIEITPVLALVEMSGISEIKSRFTADIGCQDDYKMTKTVTAAAIQGIVGAANLREGHVHAPTLVAKAAKLETLLGFENPPFFSVIDINKSHQMSFFLACLAFHQHGSRQRKLVVNFDNHADYRATGVHVSFDGWGQGFFTNGQVLETLWDDARVLYTILGQTQIIWSQPQRGTVKQLYYSNAELDGTAFSSDVALGTAAFRVDDNLWVTAHKSYSPGVTAWELRIGQESVVDGKGHAYSDDDIAELESQGVLEQKASTSHKKVFQLTTDSPAPALFRPLNGELLTAMYQIRDHGLIPINACPGSAFLDPALVGDLSQTDVYITVDRDVSRGSFTYWNDGYLQPASMRDAVKRCLAYLKSKGANLVGFDIAGLPDTLGRSTVLGLSKPLGEGADPGDQEPAIVKQARDDIEFFLKEVVAYGPTA